MPVEFVEYIKYVRELKFEEKPDYNYIQGLFISVLSKNELRNDLMFSWIINKRNKLRRGLRLKEKSVDFTKRRGGAKNTLYAKIKYSLEKYSETE